MAPGESLARLRKRMLDRVGRGEVTVVQACKDAGISRTRFYELRKRYELYGEPGLFPRRRPPTRPDRRLSAPLVDAILAYAIEHPTLGPRSIADAVALPRFGSWRVSHGGVSNVLQRAGLGTRRERLAAAEALAASEGGPLTERTLRDIRSKEAVVHKHIGSDVVGEQLFMDTMYVGRLKGVGPVWQFTACDGACSFGFARARAGKKSARAAADFLERDILPTYREAKIPLIEVVTDGGPEFKGAFRDRCKKLGIKHRVLPARSPNLNAFVERFQGTVLHLHYRVAFRYRFYTSADDIDADLAAWLRFYNFERPHRGYRTRGRRPAQIFYANRHRLLKKKGWNADDFASQSVKV